MTIYTNQKYKQKHIILALSPSRQDQMLFLISCRYNSSHVSAKEKTIVPPVSCPMSGTRMIKTISNCFYQMWGICKKVNKTHFFCMNIFLR